MTSKSKNLFLSLFLILGLLSFSQTTNAATSTKTLYSWVKDMAGNISTSQNDSVVITIPDAPTNTYYISPTGSDTTGNGTIANPWASLNKACNSVIATGNTIFVKAGTYVETLPCNLAVGVSIDGEGITSIIKSHYTTPNSIIMSTASISLVSNATGSTNGNQSISNIKLDGDNLLGSAGILIKKRSNVKVHDITIVDFFKNGIAFWGPSGYDTGVGPFTFDDGNELYNSIISNCGDIPGDNVNFSGGGLILMTAQSNMLIHDNILTETSRAQGHNGNIMNAGGRHFKGIKYYNNKSYKPDDEGPNMNTNVSYQNLPTGWNFHLEIWNNLGGFEIYNNEFHGGDTAIDCAGHDSAIGGYPYSWSIHNNLFTPMNGAASPRTSYWGKSWIVIEAKNTYKTLIYENEFNYGFTGISVWALTVDDIEIHDNNFNSALYLLNLQASVLGQYSPAVPVYDGVSFYRNKAYISYNSNYYYGAIKVSTDGASQISNVDIYNNTLVTDNVINMGGGVELTSGGVLNNIDIKNNIMTYFKNQGTIRVNNTGAINGLHIENNLSYNLNNANVMPYFPASNTGTLTNYTYLNNIPTSNTTQQNPLFISSTDFHLQPTSPAINKGQNLGLPYNGAAPDIGSFETSY